MWYVLMEIQAKGTHICLHQFGYTSVGYIFASKPNVDQITFTFLLNISIHCSHCPSQLICQSFP